MDIEAIKTKAKELKSQFGDNAKYVVLEIMDDIKQCRYIEHQSLLDRLEFWNEVRNGIDPFDRAKITGVHNAPRPTPHWRVKKR